MVSALSAAAADGTVDFNTVGSGNPVFDVNGTTALSGSGFMAQIYWSATPTGTFVAGGTAQAFLTGAAAGFVSPSFGGAASDSVTLAGTSPGGSVSVQVRAWKVSTGATWDVATTRGSSASFTVAMGGGGPPPLPNSDLSGMPGFKLTATVVPEPSTIALGLLGAGALLLRRKK